MQQTTQLVAIKPDNLANRIQRLQQEAKSLAAEHIHALLTVLDDVQRISEEIAKGGEAYPVGVRQIAQRLTDEARDRHQTITAITTRS